MKIFDGATSSITSLQSPSALIGRRELLRAAMFASTASALGPSFSFAQAVSSGLTPAARGEDGSKILTDPNWKAVFLNDHQNESLIALSEAIIPATDTPGAKEALVGGWQVNGIYTWQHGFPITVTAADLGGLGLAIHASDPWPDGVVATGLLDLVGDARLLE